MPMVTTLFRAAMLGLLGGTTLLYAQQPVQAYFRGVLERLTLIALAGDTERGGADGQGSPPRRRGAATPEGCGRWCGLARSG